MNTKILSRLLAVSLAFNIFLPIGFFLARKQEDTAKTFHGRTELLARQLNLDQDQYKVFEQLRDQFVKLRQDRLTQRRAFLTEVMKDKPDQKFLKNFCAGKDVAKYRPEVLALMQKFVRILRPEQKQMFVEIINKRFSTSRGTAAPPAK